MPPEADLVASTWRLLAAGGEDSPPRFDASTLEQVPEAAARWLGRVLPDSTPLVGGIELTMSGQIRIRRWMPFVAEQILRAGVGFVWKPVVCGRVLRFTGADLLGPSGGQMEFKLHGVVPVASASGPDTARSAAGRLAAETVAWLPQALTPQAAGRWTHLDANHAIVTVAAAGEHVDVEVQIDSRGQLCGLRLQRWKDAADPPRFDSFGGPVTGEYVTESGVRIAGTGTVGWGFGTEAWGDGEFFRYTITGARALDR